MSGWESLLSVPVFAGLAAWYIQRQFKKAIEKIESAATSEELEKVEEAGTSGRKELWIEVNSLKEKIAEVKGRLDK